MRKRSLQELTSGIDGLEMRGHPYLGSACFTRRRLF